MSWTNIFPTLSDSQLKEYQELATPLEKAGLNEQFEIARVINPRSGKHVVASSLFWRNATAVEGDLPELSREVLKDAKKLGLVNRYSPWEHYVQPLLDGARILRECRPGVVFRVYLAADLEFLVEDFVSDNAEVMLMKTSSIRHNPGAMWRFLAFDESDKWITITDADRAFEAKHDVDRTEIIMQAGHGMWRIPYIFSQIKNDSHPGFYRPINASQFGVIGGQEPVSELMKAFIWHSVRGTIVPECTFLEKGGSSSEARIHGAVWPSYGFDEWFLMACIYPRYAFQSVLTFIELNEGALNHWFSLDIEYVTWANPRSEIFYAGSGDFIRRLSLNVGVPCKQDIPIVMRSHKDKLRAQALRDDQPIIVKEPLRLVISRNRENLLWVGDLDDDVRLTIYDRGEYPIRKEVADRADQIVEIREGGEPDRILHFLLNNRYPGAGWTVFCPGDPVYFNPNFLLHLDYRHQWDHVQSLSMGIASVLSPGERSIPNFDDEVLIGGCPVRTDIISTRTLQMIGYYEKSSNLALREYSLIHDLPKGWSVGAHFFDIAGLDYLAESAWHSEIGRFAYGSLFGVNNTRIEALAEDSIIRMQKEATKGYATAMVFERLWLHIFGLPFLDIERSPRALESRRPPQIS